MVNQLTHEEMHALGIEHSHAHAHKNHHDHPTHQHTHEPSKTAARTVIEVEQEILQKNQNLAERNRGYFMAKKMVALNLISSPGSGKTAILEKTLHDINKEIPCYVVEGDQQTLNDAMRIKETNTPVIQVNTGQGCHLESEMIQNSLLQLDPKDHSLLFIENVGNLVCPAMFDLGENARVVIISVTEGDDKPIKYPDAFHGSQVCLINKIDLLPYVNFDVEKAKKYARQVNPNIEFIEVSATTGEGMQEWYKWLKNQRV
jgi:hydrogenase nickel incorporation protein HypB